MQKSAFVKLHPICLAWNRWEGETVEYKFTSRYSPVPTLTPPPDRENGPG